MSSLNANSESSDEDGQDFNKSFNYSFEASSVENDSRNNSLRMGRNSNDLPSANSEDSDGSGEFFKSTDYSTKRKRNQESEEEEDEPKPSFSFNETSSWNESKVQKTTSDLASSKAEKMMSKMGYKSGTGLGKFGQGIQEPVATSKQKGRRGLGLELKELANVTFEFDPKQEIVSENEEINWLDNFNFADQTHLQILLPEKEWISLGKCPETIDDETLFCDENVVKEVVNSKSIFDRLDKREMHEARTRSNPYETIRGFIFLNRAAVKMANMDAVCKFMFTRPHNLRPNELLYFADVCAGPGGFSEYVLWRKKWRAKGFGFTLRGENDFKLDSFHSGPCETFHTYYGPRNDGDVYQPENQFAFRDLIMRQTKIGVHFMMSDGGFSVEGKENIQEILSKQLYLCQCLVALMIVRPGGNFVTKVFDLFTPFSAGLVYLMYRCFRRISIFKPVTSRPANSERYLICESKLDDVSAVEEHMHAVNKILNSKGRKMEDVIELVPLDVIKSDERFFNYLKTSNDELGAKQIIGLKKIAYYVENKHDFEMRQKEMREKCLKLWQLPFEQSRTTPPFIDPAIKFKMLYNRSLSIVEKLSFGESNKMTDESIQEIRKTPNDWFCMLCGSSKDKSRPGSEERAATLYLSMGRFRVFHYIYNRWCPVQGVQLPPDSLIYAEMIEELRGEGQGQRKTYGLHIIDAYKLGGEDVSKKFIIDRNEEIKLFCEALCSPTQTRNTPVRAKELIPIDEYTQDRMELYTKRMKNRIEEQVHTISLNLNENNSDRENVYYYVPRSIVFLNATVKPWCRTKKTTEGPLKGKFFFHNPEKRICLWADRVPDSAYVSFEYALRSRIVWEQPSFNVNECLRNFC